MSLCSEVLILSPIGNPKNWRRIAYRLEGDCSVETEWSAVALLVKAMGSAPGHERRVDILVVAPDSLIEDGGSCSWSDVKDRVERGIRDSLSSILRRSSISGCGDVRGLLDHYADNFGLAVCPSVGTFRVGSTEYSFLGSLQLYYLCFLVNSLERIVRGGPSPMGGRPIEVWLDLSLGVNYMPSAALAATLKLSRILSSLGLEHTVRLFNSDPVLSYTREANINELSFDPEPGSTVTLELLGGNTRSGIEELFERPDMLFSRETRLKLRGGEPSAASRLMGAPTVHRALVSELWTAVANGYLLLLLSKASHYRDKLFEFGRLMGWLRDAFYAVLDGVECREEGGRRLVPTRDVLSRRHSKLYPTFMELAALFDRTLRAVVETFGGRDALNGFSLKELRDAATLTLSRVSFPHVRHFIGREIEDIRCTVLRCLCVGEDVSNWRPLSDLRSRCGTAGLGCEERPADEGLLGAVRVRYRCLRDAVGRLTERNFIAHLGLLYDLLEVKLDANTLGDVDRYCSLVR